MLIFPSQNSDFQHACNLASYDDEPAIKKTSYSLGKLALFEQIPDDIIN